MKQTTEIITITLETCCSCGVPFGIEESYRQELIKNGQTFYCTNGHNQYYTEKKTLENKLKEQKAVNKSLECRIPLCESKVLYSFIQYRFTNKLKDEGIETIGQVLKLGEYGLMKIYGIGKAAIDEINYNLNEYNIRLKP